MFFSNSLELDRAKIDPLKIAQYSSRCSIYTVMTIMSDDLLLALETKLDRLILLCNRLQQENAEFKTRESEWQRERSRLIEKNELARSRVEAMIVHLKNLDTE